MWPSSSQFSEAIQNPSTCFFDDNLRISSPAVDKFGLPFVATGQFAAVFKLQTQNRSYAIRCFTRELGDRAQRYNAINSHLDKCKSNSGIECLAQYEYDPTGMLVNGQKYPILIMEWVEGVTLDTYIEQNIGNKDVILYLANDWVRFIKILKDAKIAHGDLQHGNIIVQTDLKLKLVDFDGMYVPEMKGLKACEIGHIDYQHPLRNLNDFNLNLDNFSALVIYLSLISLSHQPDLWQQVHSEGLIFKQNDFKNPQNSTVFKSIDKHNQELQRFLDIVIDCCKKPFDNVPSLLDLVVAEQKTRLPAWMLAPTGATVTIRTREATPKEVTPPDLSKTVLKQTNQPPVLSQTPKVPTTFSKQSRQLGLFLRNTMNYLIISILPWVIACSFGNWNKEWIWLCSIVCLLIVLVKAYKETTKLPIHSKPRTYPTYTTPKTTPKTPVPSSGGQTSFIGSSIRFIYHRHSCEWAVKISPRNRVTFKSAAEAKSSGYRPCKVCYP